MSDSVPMPFDEDAPAAAIPAANEVPSSQQPAWNASRIAAPSPDAPNVVPLTAGRESVPTAELRTALAPPMASDNPSIPRTFTSAKDFKESKLLAEPASKPAAKADMHRPPKRQGSPPDRRAASATDVRLARLEASLDELARVEAADRRAQAQVAALSSQVQAMQSQIARLEQWLLTPPPASRRRRRSIWSTELYLDAAVLGDWSGATDSR